MWDVCEVNLLVSIDDGQQESANSAGQKRDVTSKRSSRTERPVSVPGDRLRRRGDIKREAVLAAAVTMFNEKGFRATSLDDVAKSLGVTKPTVYQYVSSKEEILFDCVKRGLEMIRRAAEDSPGCRKNGRERLEAAMYRYGLVMTEDFCRCVTRTSDSELNEDSRKEFRRLKRVIDEMMRRIVQAGIDDGSLRAGDARIITFAITGSLNWIGRWYEPFRDMSPEYVSSNVVRTLLAGVSA